MRSTTRRSGLCLFATLVLAAPAASGQPAADDRARAREAFERGVVEMEAGRFQPALDAFNESLAIRATQVALLNAGKCLESLHRPREALQAYERFLVDFRTEATAPRRAHAEERIRELRATMGTLAITVDVAGAAVSLDGEPIGTSPLAEPVMLPAGTHVVTARVEGRPEATATATVRAGEAGQLALQVPVAAPEPVTPVDDGGAVQPPPPPTPGPRPPPRSGLGPTLFWSVAGLALAGAVATGILGALVVAQDSDYRDSVPRTAEDQSAGQDLVLVTDIVFGVTAAAAVGALVLFALTDFGGDRPDEEQAVRLQLDLGPASAGLRLSGEL